MSVIIRSVQNNTSNSITLFVPGYDDTKSPVIIPANTTIDLFTVLTADQLEAVQSLLNEFITVGDFTVISTVDTSIFNPVGGVTSIPGSTAVDPMNYGAAGIITTTTGSITEGQNILTVASATGWAIGMGIAVANAGSGGNTELITSVTAISGNTFTLQANAISTVISQTVNHDDTVAIATAIASGNPVKIRAGNYNITSGFTISNPITLQGEGGDFTVIWNRSSTSNIFTISYTISGTDLENNPIPVTSALISDFQIIQDPNVTPVSGYGFFIQGISDTNLVTNLHLERIIMKQIYGGVYASNGMVSNWFKDLYMVSLVGGYGIYIDSPIPSGDSHWIDIELSGYNTGVAIVEADTQEFVNLKVNESGISFLTANNNRVQRIRFIDCSIEGSQGNCYDFGSNGATEVQIVGGGIGFNTEAAISAINCPGLQIVGTIIYSGNNGIVLSGSATNATITGNTLVATAGQQIVLSNGATAEICANTGFSTLIGSTFSSLNSNSTIYAGTSSINSSAIIEADSITQGFLPPRMTEVQREAIVSPAIGLMVYQTDDDTVWFNTSTGWKSITPS